MSKKIQSTFMANYILMFIISTIIAVFAFMLLSFASDVISKNLVKNTYTAESLMQDDYTKIKTEDVLKNAGGIQVVNKDFEIVYSKGLNTFLSDKLTASEFTDFLTSSKQIGRKYSYSIKYNSSEQFWLILTFPTSIRIDFAIAHNDEFNSVDAQSVIGVIVAVIMFYLILLAACTVIYSKLTSISIINPLKKLCISAKKLKEGDYSSRVTLNLKNEFGELECIFNEMANQIENEIYLKNQAEANRKQLILHVSHDLKNPLSSIMGYSELLRKNPDISKEENDNYIKIINENSIRANHLITDLFELSKMESSEYHLNRSKVDICEYIRQELATYIFTFENHEFIFNFDIPENEIFAFIDTKEFKRVFENLVSNAVKYNPAGTKVEVVVSEKADATMIIFKDNGVGIRKEFAENIFEPFERADRSINSNTGGTGLGLAIVEKIIKAHNGEIHINTDENCGCEFSIIIPKI